MSDVKALAGAGGGVRLASGKKGAAMSDEYAIITAKLREAAMAAESQLATAQEAIKTAANELEAAGEELNEAELHHAKAKLAHDHAIAAVARLELEIPIIWREVRMRGDRAL
jgi:uncharacterized protein YPO0396